MKDVAQQLTEAVDLLDHLGEVVIDVAQVALQLVVGAVLREAQRELAQHGRERTGGALELDDLAGQLVDAPRHRGIPAEDLGLDLVDVVLEARDDRQVAVDDPVQDRVEDRLGPEPEQVRVALETAPDGGDVGRLRVPERDDEVPAHEEVDLAELDLLDVVEIAGRAQDDEQGVVVPLQLGALVGDDRVLDREFVEAELLGQRGELVVLGPVQPDPGDGLVVVVEGAVALGERGRRRDPVTVDVHRAVDQAGAGRPAGAGRDGGAGRDDLRRTAAPAGQAADGRADGPRGPVLGHARSSGW